MSNRVGSSTRGDAWNDVANAIRANHESDRSKPSQTDDPIYDAAAALDHSIGKAKAQDGLVKATRNLQVTAREDATEYVPLSHKTAKSASSAHRTFTDSAKVHHDVVVHRAQEFAALAEEKFPEAAVEAKAVAKEHAEAAASYQSKAKEAQKEYKKDRNASYGNTAKKGANAASKVICAAAVGAAKATAEGVVSVPVPLPGSSIASLVHGAASGARKGAKSAPQFKTT